MPYVYIVEKGRKGLYIGVEMDAIPRVGEDIYVSFRRVLDDPQEKAKYTKEFIEMAERAQGFVWRCTAVLHEAYYLREKSNVKVTVEGRPL